MTRVRRVPVPPKLATTLAAAVLLAFVAAPAAIANSTYQALPFSQNWSNTGLITTSDNWSGVPGIQGFRGDGLVASTGVDPRTVTANDSPGVIDVNANQTTPNSFATFGVTEFQIADPVVAIAGDATAAAPYLVLYVNAAGRYNVQVAYTLRDVESSTDHSVQQVALQFRTSAAGTWTSVAAGYVADATDGPSLTKTTSVSATLPAAANGAATLQIRILTTDAAGTDEWVGIDDISVTGTPEPFADVTSGPLGSASAAVGVAWGDFDGDGDLDLYQTKFAGGTNALYRNDAGTWVSAASGAIAAASDGRGATAADIDNDGDLDLHVSNYQGGANALDRNDAGVWVDATGGAIGGTHGTQSAVWLDVDGDGDLDLYEGNQGANRLLRNDAGTWVDATTGPLGNTALTKGLAAADFDNDGDLDLFLGNQGAASKLLRNDGAGNFTDVTAPPLDAQNSVNGASAGDVDNDGDLDLYVTAASGATCRLLRNDLGSWVDVTSGPLGVTTGASGSTLLDVDNDGDLDLYVCRTSAANLLFRNDAGTWVDATGTVAANTSQSQGVAAGDYEGDGDLDLYLVNNGAANKLYRNENANGNHWLHVKLAGTISNRSAIGTRVRVVAGGVTRIAEVASLTGEYGENSLPVEFGLGSATSLDSLVVRWPSGVVQVVSPPPAVNQVVTVTEPTPLFVNATTSPLGTSQGSGVVWGDFDGDGDLDLYYTRISPQPNRLFRNDAGAWVDATSGALGSTRDSRAVTAGDFDHDGDLDLYVANLGAANQLLRNDGGTWVDATSGAASGTGTAHGVTWIDFDLDGDLDLYVANYGANQLLRNDAGTWVDATSGPLGDASQGVSVAAGDFDGDGDLDLYLANLGAPNKLFRNDAGTWVDATTAPLDFDDNSTGVVAGDFDNDADLDLYVCSYGGAGNRLFRNDGASWSDATTGALGLAAMAAGATAGDFDQDGDLDLYVTVTGGNDHLLRNDGGAWIDASALAPVNGGASYGVAAGDADGDGDLDLYVANQSTGGRLFRNETTGRHWLAVKLVGTASNRSAIGARVRVVAGGVTRIREVAGSTGTFSQNALTASFGLGASSSIDSVVVRWPSGVVQSVTPPTVDQTVTVTEVVPPTTPFTDVTSAPLDVTGESIGTAWGDVDGDGDLDLMVTAWGDDHLFRNLGGSWVDATSGALVSNDSNDGPAFGDYDNDGDLDLYLSKGGLQSFEGRPNQLLRNDAGTWVDATVPPLDDGNVGRGVAWADVDRDGDLDLYLTNRFGANKLFRDDAGTWVDATTGPLGPAATSNSVTFGDYDNDGDLDLFMVNFLQPCKLLRNNGASWVDVSSASTFGTGNSIGADWGDYDNDGDLDLYVARFGANSRLLRNDGGVLVALTNPLLAGTDSNCPMWGDFDNDGDLDLYVAGYQGNALYRNDSGTWVDATTPTLAAGVNGQSTAWGDYDGDGDLDLYVAKFDDTNQLLRNDASGNHWLHAKLVGTMSNRSAIGARVTLLAGGVRRMQEVSGGSGAMAQNSLDVEFGLGATTTIDSLIVRWPSGLVWDTTGVAIDQKITLVEHARANGIGESAALPRALALRVAPNPCERRARVEWALPHAAYVKVQVLDLQGRVVATLAERVDPAGLHAVIWEGRRASGAAALPGVYFARLEAGGAGIRIRKIVLTR